MRLPQRPSRSTDSGLGAPSSEAPKPVEKEAPVAAPKKEEPKAAAPVPKKEAAKPAAAPTPAPKKEAPKPAAKPVEVKAPVVAGSRGETRVRAPRYAGMLDPC